VGLNNNTGVSMQMETPFFIVIMDDFKFRQEKSPNLSTRAFFESGAGKETRTPDPNLGKSHRHKIH
ncbi:MAG: hypothetical protein RSC68_34165, partial [Acinetobacter sp.]